MSQPEPNQNEPSKLKKLLSAGDSDESPISRLQRTAGKNAPAKTTPAALTSQPKQGGSVSTPKPASKPRAASKPGARGLKFLPAFWTVASILSMTVNIVLLIVLALVVQNFKTVGVTLTALPDHLLGGLYHNFVKMDNASIKTQIPVNANIPLNITVPVRATTRITLAEAAVIRNAQVIINTGSLDINASATVTLPANTPLTVNLDFPLQVTDTIPVSLPVDVNIPLNQTELHEPFVGLRQVVEPFYCMLNDCP